MKKEFNTIKKLVPLIYSLGIASTGIGIMSGVMVKMFGEEIKKRLLEFKLMGVIEIEIHNKHNKTKIEYHLLEGIEKYLDNFVKKNPKWKYEKEDYAGIITGRYILTRVYRTYHKKSDEDEEYCQECGRYYDV